MPQKEGGRLMTAGKTALRQGEGVQAHLNTG